MAWFLKEVEEEIEIIS